MSIEVKLLILLNRVFYIYYLLQIVFVVNNVCNLMDDIYK
jgi:hypothetical protein